jgi:hypothetical protein
MTWIPKEDRMDTCNELSPVTWEWCITLETVYGNSWDLRLSQRWLWRAVTSGIWRHIVRWTSADVSEEFVASIFKQSRLCLLPVPCWFLAYTWTLKFEATCSSETSVEIQQASRRYIPIDGTLYGNSLGTGGAFILALYLCFKNRIIAHLDFFLW